MSELNVNGERAVALEVRSLKGQYIVNDLSFSIAKKGIHGILAPMGAGKTELLDIISGSRDAVGGGVRLFGKEVSSSDLSVKKKIGYVPEYSCLYSDMTVLEIMSFVGESKGVESGKLIRQIKEALELTDLYDSRDRLVGRLTEYDKKKLALSAALLGNPEIILVDEPVAKKMSGERQSEIMGILSMLGKMKTIIIATQIYGVAKELCEDVVILSDGKLVCAGTFEALEEKLRAAEGNKATLEQLYESIASYSSSNKKTS